MKSDALRTARFLAFPTLGLIAVIAFVPGRAGLAVRIYALLLCGLALGLALAALRRAYPPAAPLRARTRRRREATLRPPTLIRIEQEVALGAAGAFEFHRGLRKRMRVLATELLAHRRGVPLDEAPDAARRILGDETWELVRSDRPLPKDRLARGPAPADLSRAVDSLERI